METRERAFVPRIQNTIEVGIPKIC